MDRWVKHYFMGDEEEIEYPPKLFERKKMKVEYKETGCPFGEYANCCNKCELFIKELEACSFRAIAILLGETKTKIVVDPKHVSTEVRG